MPISQFVNELELALKRKDGYIMGSRGQNPRTGHLIEKEGQKPSSHWEPDGWYYTQYSGNQREKALYWREHAERVWDCNGLAEGIYEMFSGININSKARYNYAEWCDPKGTGMIPVEYRVPGAAVFWGDKASKIHHVAYLYKPVKESDPAGDWYIIEAMGVMYGVVQKKLYSRKPNFWGLMTKYFDYGKTDYTPVEYKLGDRLLEEGMTGNDVKELQERLNALGFNCGDANGEFDSKTETAVKNFQKANNLVVDGEYGAKSHAAMLKSGEATPKNMVTITGGSVNIRKGPGTSYGVLKVAHKGDTFERIDTTDWVCVKYNDDLCWAFEDYVIDGICTASSLNIRKGPDTDYTSIGKVKKGYRFTKVDTNGWVPIKINGAIYWVSAKYAE